jgi:hypothetical protein
MKNIIASLKCKYTNIFSCKENRPSWSVKKLNTNEVIHPSIPFVGKNFETSKLLLYASAENLTHYHKIKKPYLEDDRFAINRHRNYFDQSATKENRSFFPYVHIAPIEDGALVMLTAYILKCITGTFDYQTPYELLENISFGNFGKFSIVSDNKNKDYAHNVDCLRYSYRYIKTDIETINPKILILPKTIYETISEDTEIQELLSKIPLIIPVYQINAATINRIITKKYVQKSFETDILYTWHKKLTGNIKGKTKENFLSVYTYIDSLLTTLKFIK